MGGLEKQLFIVAQWRKKSEKEMTESHAPSAGTGKNLFQNSLPAWGSVTPALTWPAPAVCAWVHISPVYQDTGCSG